MSRCYLGAKVGQIPTHRENHCARLSFWQMELTLQSAKCADNTQTNTGKTSCIRLRRKHTALIRGVGDKRFLTNQRNIQFITEQLSDGKVEA